MGSFTFAMKLVKKNNESEKCCATMSEKEDFEKNLGIFSGFWDFRGTFFFRNNTFGIFLGIFLIKELLK